MKLRPNPRYAEFANHLRTMAPALSPWTGVTFRSVRLEHATPEKILSGEGSLRCGGRWNAPASFAVVYSSTRPGTAAEEAFRLASDFGLRPEELKPRLVCGIEWKLARVLDLMQPVLPDWLRLSDWMQEQFAQINDGGFETLCQAFGRASRNSGVSALLSPSLRATGGVNLVVFRDRLRKTEGMRLLGEDELKRHRG